MALLALQIYEVLIIPQRLVDSAPYSHYLLTYIQLYPSDIQDSCKSPKRHLHEQIPCGPQSTIDLTGVLSVLSSLQYWGTNNHPIQQYPCLKHFAGAIGKHWVCL